MSWVNEMFFCFERYLSSFFYFFEFSDSVWFRFVDSIPYSLRCVEIIFFVSFVVVDTYRFS